MAMYYSGCAPLFALEALQVLPLGLLALQVNLLALQALGHPDDWERGEKLYDENLVVVYSEQEEGVESRRLSDSVAAAEPDGQVVKSDHHHRLI